MMKIDDTAATTTRMLTHSTADDRPTRYSAMFCGNMGTISPVTMPRARGVLSLYDASGLSRHWFFGTAAVI